MKDDVDLVTKWKYITSSWNEAGLLRIIILAVPPEQGSLQKLPECIDVLVAIHKHEDRQPSLS